MSVLQHFYDSQKQQQRNKTTKDMNTTVHSSTIPNNVRRNSDSRDTGHSKSCWNETTAVRSATNQSKEIVLTSVNSKSIAEPMAEVKTVSQSKSFIIGLILGMLVAGTSLVVIIVLWRTPQTSAFSSTDTTMTSTITTTSTTTTTVSSTSTTTSTSTSSTTTSTSTSVSSTTTSATSTTTTAPPSNLCVTTNQKALTNNSFLYSLTSQTYAAGMLNNQFGVYVAYGYRNVTSTTIWTAQQSSTSTSCYLALQTDRNLVVYTVNGSSVLWTPQTENNHTGYPFCIKMLDSGNLIWIDNTLSIIWQSNSTVQTG